MSHVIRILGFANGQPCPHEGEYVKTMDFEAHGGRGYLTTTPDIAEAKKFAGFIEAAGFWKTISKTRPKRPDGKPNRPLTAAHVEIERDDSDSAVSDESSKLA